MSDQVLDETKLRALVKALRYALIGMVGLAVVGGIALVVQSRKRTVAEEGFAALAAAEVLEQDAANEAQTLNLDTPEEAMKKWPDAKKSDYEAKLKSVVDAHEGTTPGVTAGLKLAHWKLVNGQVDEAAALFETLLKKTQSSSMALLRAMTYEGLGAARETQKNFEEALKVYLQALDDKANPLKPLAYLGKARSAVAVGKKDDAKAALESLAKEFPNTAYERRARALQAILIGG